MSRSMIVYCLAFIILSLVAFGFVSWHDSTTNAFDAAGDTHDRPDLQLTNAFVNKVSPDFFYDVGTRFAATIAKENLHNADSVVDIVPKEANWASHSIQTIEVTVFHSNGEVSEIGNNATLNEAQLRLLRSTEYSDNFRLIASCKRMHENTGDWETYNLAYYLTVIPERVAEYVNGKDALLDYLKENSREVINNIGGEKLQPGKLNFTITNKGAITNVKLEATSGYRTIDEKMVDLMSSLPGKWEPAENFKGEKIEQGLVLFFGIIGC